MAAVHRSFERQVRLIVRNALREDLGSGDITTESLIPSGLDGRGRILSRSEGVLAGMEVARVVFGEVDPLLKWTGLLGDGSSLKQGSVLAAVEGKAAGILSAERVALNFLQRLCGIATLTAQYVSAVSGMKAVIVDTRKTTPGLRLLEKYAVRVGGGRNHRGSLGDGVLIKDNHLAALRHRGAGLEEAIEKARKHAPHTLKIEIEVETVEQAVRALTAGADIILLDNMSLDDMRRVVEVVRGQALIEASGGVTLETVRAVAETGVDFISIGALTHSAVALDISLELEYS
ncbi:MAG: carboxylating nicotinate-nucleotide diphosphorylase [Dehalococcoidia bacterium]|nr:carboxylating nicotinate-nucleotide diphosphorylase [Dehalococcoidia bacterium]